MSGKMNMKSLKNFLVEANRAGYAGGERKKWVKEKDGSTTISFKKGLWRSHDNFFGGEPYGGRTVVFYKNKPVWIMVYYGWVEEGVKTDPVYKVLRNALQKMPKANPFRGPEIYEEEDNRYLNSWDGEIERFSGEESITKSKKVVYKAKYMGGLVDQREGD